MPSFWNLGWWFSHFYEIKAPHGKYIPIIKEKKCMFIIAISLTFVKLVHFMSYLLFLAFACLSKLKDG